MSKLAHSNEQTMTAIEFEAALRDGNEDMAEGYWWVRLGSELRVAEWRYQIVFPGGKWRWEWSLTRGEEADPRSVTVIERIEEPKQ